MVAHRPCADGRLRQHRFTREYAEGILLVAEEYFEQAFAGAEPGADLDFLRALVPYVWARWR